MILKTPVNPNYCATVVRIEQLRPLENCTNVQAAVLFSCQVIVGMDTQVGEVGLFFPVETALSPEFLSNNNLYRETTLNVDQTKKGYFEAHGRIRCVKFRGHKSEGFYIPLDALKYIPYQELPWYEDYPIHDNQDHLLGKEFDQIGEHLICQKYVARCNPAPQGKKQGRSARVEDRIVLGQFRFHVDTTHLRRNTDKIHPDSWVTITDKWHGTSVIVGNVLVNRQLKWWERALRDLGVSIRVTEYGLTWASRRVVKGVAGQERASAVHYYGEDVWGLKAKEIGALIPEGVTLYGEIVGFTPNGASIQKGYHYGCMPTHKSVHSRFVVYRVTLTNHRGRVMELSYRQMAEMCKGHGWEVVPLLWEGRAEDFTADKGHLCPEYVETFGQGFLVAVEKTFVTDGLCPHNNNEVPAEGVVVRIEHLDECEVYKCKNTRFLEWETKMLDTGEEDMEEQDANQN